MTKTVTELMLEHRRENGPTRGDALRDLVNRLRAQTIIRYDGSAEGRNQAQKIGWLLAEAAEAIDSFLEFARASVEPDEIECPECHTGEIGVIFHAWGCSHRPSNDEPREIIEPPWSQLLADCMATPCKYPCLRDDLGDWMKTNGLSWPDDYRHD